jgi:hypothetical protein
VPLALDVSLSLSGLLTRTLDLSTPTDTIGVGQGAFPAAAYTLDDGNGDLQAQQWWHDLRTVAAAGNDDIDLSGVLASPFNDTLAFLTIRLMLLVIVTPGPTKRLRVGPQNVANGWQGPFGGTGAQAYVEFDQFQKFARTYTGWTVTPATGDILRVNNPGATTDYAILVAGTTS